MRSIADITPYNIQGHSLQHCVTMNLNLSGFLNVFRLIAKPSLCLPHATVSTFNDLPSPLEKAFERSSRKSVIKAVILDKDDCFAYPDTNEIHPPYLVS